MKSKNYITTTILLSLVIGLSFNAVYAEVVEMPQLPTSNMIDKKVWTQYTSDNKYTVNISVLYQVDSPIEIPDQISWVDIYGQVHTIFLQEEFNIANSQGDDSTSPPEENPTEKADRIIEKKRAEEQKTIDELYEDALLCTFGDDPDTPEVEGRSVWQADAQFEIAEEMDYFKHLPQSYQEREFILKTEECEKFMDSWMYDNAQYNSIAEAQKTDIQPWELDETNSPDTPDPVTQEDKDAEEQDAVDYSCSNLGKMRGLCPGEFSGINRGDKYGYSLPANYGTYEDQRDDSTSLSDSEKISRNIQCTVYYPLYAQTSAEIPKFLEHCVEAESNE